jgi:two-component system capsular synthesis sensor histidine kinase RcsC
MQRILDTTEATLSRAFQTLADNSRREHRLFYVTAWALGIVIAFAAVLGTAIGVRGFVAEKEIELMGHAANADLFVRREYSFIRHTEMAFRHDWIADNTALGETGLTPLGSSVLEPYSILLPASASTREDSYWSRRARNLAHTLVSSMDASSALQAYPQIAILGVDQPFAAYFPTLNAAAGATKTDHHAREGRLARMLAPFTTAELPQSVPGAPARPIWIGPQYDVEQGVDVMRGAVAVHLRDHTTAVVAASVPASEFLAAIPAVGDGATYVLFDHNGRPVTALGENTLPVRQAMVTHFDTWPSATGGSHSAFLTWGSQGLILSAPLSSGFGNLAYRLSYPAAIGAMRVGLIAIVGSASLLLILLLLGTRYCDRNLLQRNRRQAARALENETLNHIIVSATPVGLMIVTRPDLNVITINTLALSLTGMRTPDLMPPALAADFLQHMEDDQIVSSFARIFEFEHHVCQNGIERTLQITYAPALYKRQDVLFCAITEVTAQKAIETELRAARAASERLMHARSHFFASMNHEIRTPLHVLLGNLELFSSSTTLLPEHRARLDILGQAAQNLLRVANDILDISKLDAGKVMLSPSVFSPAQLFENLAQAHAPLITSKGLRFYFSLDPSCLCELRGDACRIEQIAHNLLVNAAKFTHVGKVLLSVRVISPERHSEIGETWPADEPGNGHILALDVVDSGIGVAADVVPRLFAPFQQGSEDTYSEYGGSGLGLSICAHLCQIMGGTITVESVRDLGSRFSVRLPVDIHAFSQSPVAVQPRPALAVCYRALEYRDVLTAWLEYAGYTVHTFTALPSQQALQRLGVSAVVITDDFSGWERAQLQMDVGVPVFAFLQTAGLPDERTTLTTEIVARRPSALLSLPTIENKLSEQVSAADNGHYSPSIDFIVIDDCPLSRQLLCEQLETAGYRTSAHGDAPGALLVLQNSDPLAVLTDLDMPGMTGAQLLQRLHRSHPSLPVVAVSASTQDDEVSAGLEMGFFDYLGKPISRRQLAAVLNRIGNPSRRGPAPTSTARAVLASSHSQEFMQKRWRYFNTLLPAELDALHQALNESDASGLMAWLHKMRGALGVLDEPALAARCLSLEEGCESSATFAADLKIEARAITQAITLLNRNHDETSQAFDAGSPILLER